MARHRRNRRRHEEEEGNHERWLVSYADFITLLFAFFVVMYAISSVNEGRYRALGNSLQNAFGIFRIGQVGPKMLAPVAPAPVPNLPPVFRHPDLSVTSVRDNTAAHMRELADRIATALEPLVHDGTVRVTQTGRGIMVEINAAILFDAGRADLQAASLVGLDALAQILAGVPNAILVEGHTDNQPIQTSEFRSNWELSSARATSVVRFLMGRGIEARRLGAAGYAEFRPEVSNDTAEGRARNRRVAIVILADPADDPSSTSPVATPSTAIRH